MSNGNSNNPYPMKVFVFGSDAKLGNEIIKLLEQTPAGHETKYFPDGERIPHQTETVRGCDVFIIFNGLNGLEIDRWLIDYLRFVRAVKRGHPYRITVILPKKPHQRADVANQKKREPKMSDFYPDLLKTAGADYIIVCRLHNPASCTSDPPMDNVDTTFLINRRIREMFPDLSSLAIAAGDMGGSKYAREVANKLGVPLIIVDKNRDKNSGETKVMKIYTEGDISQKIKIVVFVDDLMSTFGTLQQGADELSRQYPHITDFYGAATHPDFGEKTLNNIINSKFKEIWITDSVPVKDEFVREVELSGKKVFFISVANVLARVIDNVHDSKPISSLWEQ